MLIGVMSSIRRFAELIFVACRMTMFALYSLIYITGEEAGAYRLEFPHQGTGICLLG